MSRIKELWNDRINQASYFRWMMLYSKPYIGKISIMMIFSLLGTLSTLLMTQITKEIIDDATSGTPFVKLIVIYIGLMVLMNVLSIVSSLMSTLIDERFSFGIRKQVYEKILNSYWMNIKKYHTGDLMTRLTSDAGAIADGIVNTIPSIIQLIIELILVFFYLFAYSHLLALLALAVAPVAAITSWWLGRKIKKLQVKVQESESAYRSFMQESLANLLIVKAFANEDYSTKKLVDLREKRFFWVFKRAKIGVASSTVMSASFQIAYLAAFAYGALQISKGLITYGTMSVFLTLVNRVQAPIIGLAQQIPQVVSVLASAGRVIELQDIPYEEKLQHNLEGKEIGVDLTNVTFGYSNDIVLNNISLNIKPGEFVAIIGESGIGKTTLIRLMMSFMSNYSGKISFYNSNGDIEQANASTREFISYVPQGNTLFSGTIYENIKMGNINASIEEMYEALKLAAGYDFVMELPQQIDTVIGERGHGISEGQAQRIAIARALVKKAPLLILDEATSALDEKTEQEVINGLQQISPRPTCIVITHRKSVLKYCNREIKIENKEIFD